MEFAVLASGSNGNSIYVEEGDTKLLIDAGLSGKAIEKKLAEVQKSPQELSGIIATHEHQDHVKGVGVLARRYQLHVYATYGTWCGMDNKIGTIPEERKTIMTGQRFNIDNIHIDPFPVSHDANEPVGLCITGNDKKLGIATDSGVFTPHMKESLKGCHGLILESNHDLNLLSKSRYPQYLKQRIRSNKGHLSNMELAKYLPDLLDNNVSQLILGHLSEDNNHPDIVKEYVHQVFEKLPIEITNNVTFNIAEREGRAFGFEL
ncbi:MBL fold metallo-hydrolase [Natranaerobius trueperi]|uniref:MBL fold metallo-hydrolase n=1 Tax=Natranaerobius trueperi TaxID=759412 RepID=A0A226BWY2_9FIRM|nr:MBL fold metallo-hydrolase [Natranaerobius trueperi]OWZ83506.1 MBL fold metallo-hydrolase [Natranaerobius trueperi]